MINVKDDRRDYHEVTIAVTGGSGYLASALIPALQRAGARVVCVTRQASIQAPGVERLTADVRTETCWPAIVARADVIFHLAGNTSVYAAANDPAASLQATVAPLIHLATAARAARRRPRVVFASTATVYGLTDTLPVDEDAPLNAVTVYDRHKVSAERQLAQASGEGVLDGVSLRLANVYGPSTGGGADGRGVLNTAAARAMRGADLHVFGDGSYTRDYVYIDDVIRAFIAAGVHPGMSGRAFNVASGTGTTVQEAFRLLAARAERITGTRSVVRSVAWPAQVDPIERRHFTAHIDRIATACGWRPVVSLTDGVDRLVDVLAQAGTACG